MIGNDVVDLAAASKESNWKRPGFLNKIFTEREQSYILNSDNPELSVWLLWSMKESAYKIYVQQSNEIFYAPLRFECKITNKLNNNFYGEVSFKSTHYKTTSESTNGAIFTVAFPELHCSEGNITYKKLKLSNTHYRTQHKEIYLAALKEISRLKDKPLKQFTIKKNSFGIPEILNDGQHLCMSLSLSHHGRYGAFAMTENAFK